MGVKAGTWHLRSIRRQQSLSTLSIRRKNKQYVTNGENGEKVPYDVPIYDLEDPDHHQTAGEIFTITDDHPCSLNRRMIVDGHEVEYKLQKDVTRKPEKKKNMTHAVKNKNLAPSPIEVRIRLWVLKHSICMICFFYLILFVLLNVIFAGLWMIPKENCCGLDSSSRYADNFKFAIYTSTTLGYGGYQPANWFAETLIVLNVFLAMTLNILFGGVLFLKFVTPSAKIEFSEIITLSNVNGVPCLEMRVGNADGRNMLLTDVEAKLMFMYAFDYKEQCGEKRSLFNSQKLELLSDWRHELSEVWTLRHVIDEESPLFGVMGTKMEENIRFFRLCVSATQAISKTTVSASIGYGYEDVIIGHRFQDQISYDQESQTLLVDYDKMNETEPHPVWFPVREKEMEETERSETTINGKISDLSSGYDSNN